MSLSKSEREKFKALQELVSKYGYWSDEVKEYNSHLDHSTMTKLNNLVRR